MSTSASAAHVEQGSDPRRWKLLGLLGIAQFMLILDVTVVAIALPQVGADLALSREALTWVVSAYTVAFGGLMLLGGRTADLFGARNLVFAGLTVFTLGSLAAGLADGGQVLLAGRIAQGVGAAMLSPSALSTVVRLFEGEERNKALGIWSSLGGVGAAAGVLLGGLITAGPGWPWVFFINVPVGLAIGIGLTRLMPSLPPVTSSRRLDVLGAALVSAATGVAIYALVAAGDIGWTSSQTLLTAAATVVLYALFAWRQSRAAAPLMNPELATRRPVVAGVFVIAIATALMVAIFFLGTFYFQDVAGHGPLVTGLLFLPVALATMVGANIAGQIISGIGARALGALGMGVAAVGLAAPAIWPATLATTLGVSLGAFGIGTLFVVASATALAQVAPHEAGIASGILSTFHEFGAAAGAAVVSSIAAKSLYGGSTDGFQSAFVAAAIAALAAAVVSAGLIPGRARNK